MGRLTPVVVAWAKMIAEVPTTLTAMAWLSLGPDIGRFPADRQNEPGSPEMRSLRAPSSNQSTGQRLSRY